MTTSASTHCTFCGRPEQEVAKMIAGPGVYICDGCVNACQQILASAGDAPAPRLPAWESLTDDQVLDRLPRIAATGAQAEASLRAWVDQARQRGSSWATVGAALGMSRQSAWERFTAAAEPDAPGTA